MMNGLLQRLRLTSFGVGMWCGAILMSAAVDVVRATGFADAVAGILATAAVSPLYWLMLWPSFRVRTAALAEREEGA